MGRSRPHMNLRISRVRVRRRQRIDGIVAANTIIVVLMTRPDLSAWYTDRGRDNCAYVRIASRVGLVNDCKPNRQLDRKVLCGRRTVGEDLRDQYHGRY